MANGLGGNMFAGFGVKQQGLSNAIGQGINLYAQQAQKQQELERAEQKQVRALAYLTKASELAGSDPAQSEKAFLMAMKEEPEFVTSILQARKMQAEASTAGGAKPMTEYQRESLRLRELEADLKQEDNSLRREKLEQDIALQKAKVEKTQQEVATEAEDREVAKEQASAEIDSTINLIDRMIEHPGREMATGSTSVAASIPGTRARGFRAMLDTLKGRQFLDAVQNMKGLGQLSNAEGEKLAAAAASLDLGMPEDEFLAELERIKSTFQRAKNTKPGTYNSESNRSQNTVSWDDM